MTAAMLVLEPILEADLPPEQYAYRPGRSAPLTLTSGAFHLPFGMIYATNIMPIRQVLYPAFPYRFYALMKTEDALSIKDYLFSLEPVNSSPPGTSLDFPYNQRFLRAWKWLFVRQGKRQDDPQPTQDQNRCAYPALGHRRECHAA